MDNFLVLLNVISIALTGILIPVGYFLVKNIRSKPAVDELMNLMRTAANEQLQLVQVANSDFAAEIRASRQEAIKRAEEEVKDLRDRVNTLAGRYTDAIKEIRELRDELIKEVRDKGKAEARLAAVETEVRLLRERYENGK